MPAQIVALPQRLPDSAFLYEAAVHAHAHGNHLVHRGDGDVFVSPVVLPGWFEVGISVRPAREAA